MFEPELSGFTTGIPPISSAALLPPSPALIFLSSFFPPSVTVFSFSKALKRCHNQTSLIFDERW